jgi:fermentation-respiration switch protein FrsA (DUF1100 family)
MQSKVKRVRPWYVRLLYSGLRVLLLVCIAWCAMLYIKQDSILFPVDMAPEAPAQPRLTQPGSERLFLELEDGSRVEAWLLPGEGASEDRPAPLVIFCHGNAEIIDHQKDIALRYQRLGCSVLLPEYRGYGRSGGRPSERGIVADAVAFYDQAVTHPTVDADRVVIHGRSLGGGVAAQLAGVRPCRALILESSFTSVAAMARDYWAPGFLVKHPFRTDRVIRQLSIPILIFHGTQDPIIPVEHGRMLHELAQNSIYVEFDCGHNEFPGTGNYQAYWEQIESFLEGARVIGPYARRNGP